MNERMLNKEALKVFIIGYQRFSVFIVSISTVNYCVSSTAVV